MIRLTLPLPPSANMYWRAVNVGGKRARVLLSKDARAYQNEALAVAYRAGVKAYPKGEAVRVRLVVHFPDRRGDLDNRVKPTLDALRGVAFQDDRQVWELEVIRETDPTAPRVEVEVTSLDRRAA